MVRKPRIWFPGAKYHITSRGIRRTTLFQDDSDRSEYLYLLEEVKGKFPFDLHTYCLMTNHIHLQIKTIDHAPHEIMRYLHTKYAKYFNKRYEYSGHVFESRYGSELIDSPEYELDVSKYIHLNPLRANIVNQLEDYQWSSCRSYILGEENLLISTNQIFSYFSDPQKTHYKRYLSTPNTKLLFLNNGKVEISVKPDQSPDNLMKVRGVE